MLELWRLLQHLAVATEGGLVVTFDKHAVSKIKGIQDLIGPGGVNKQDEREDGQCLHVFHSVIWKSVGEHLTFLAIGETDS